MVAKIIVWIVVIISIFITWAIMKYWFIPMWETAIGG